MQNTTGMRRLQQAVLIASFAVALPGCGFLTAPIGLAGAELASAGVKTVDYGINTGVKAAEHGINAGVKVADYGLSKSEIAAKFIQAASIKGYKKSKEIIAASIEFALSGPTPKEQETVAQQVAQ